MKGPSEGGFGTLSALAHPSPHEDATPRHHLGSRAPPSQDPDAGSFISAFPASRAVGNQLLFFTQHPVSRCFVTSELMD